MRIALATGLLRRRPESLDTDEASGSAAGSDGPRHRGWVLMLLFGLACLIVFNANLRTIGAGDTLPARYLPLVMWHDHSLHLDASARLLQHGHPMQDPPPQTAPPGSPDYVTTITPRAYWLVRAREGHLGSLYPIVAPLLVAPLYLPAHQYLTARGYAQPDVDRVAELMEKLSASLLAAIASVLLFVLLRRERNPWAFPLAAAFAFGTNVWMIASQALWQHSSGVLLVTLGLLLAVQRASPWRMVALGFVAVLIAANRPPDAIIAGALVLVAAWRDPRDLRWLAAGAALPLAALLAFNLMFIGNLIGGYASEGAGKDFFRIDLLGPAGMLLSPARGLLIFTPFLAFVGVGLAERLRDPRTRHLAIVLSGAVVAQLIIYSQTDWRAGTSWGPRWLTDLLPILVWMLAPAPALLRPTARRVLVGTMVMSVVIQAIGAFWYDGTSDERIFAGGPRSTAAAWKPANTPFIVELEHGPATSELRCGASGLLERVGTTITLGDRPVPPPRLKQGTPIEGWALTCQRSPAQVLLLLDGVVIGATSRFTPRPDVNAALGTTAPPGWHVDADLGGVPPGRHVLQVAVRVAPRSNLRMLAERAVTIPAPTTTSSDADLRDLAARASAQLQGRQNSEGYWLTTFTGSTRYTGVSQELNTYTTAVLVDLLRPVAARNGLDGALARARGHLAAQIEPNGLVRYHGLPDAPTIGTLGCRITPDADDTALTWRIAGPGADDSRALRMLRTLAAYRDQRGFYKTWLAPRDRYECLDPGRNPNPGDRVNQMHVYLMLRQFDPPAARRLCAAIQRAARADAALVYYARTPLMPFLRSAELGRRGCPLPLPTARLNRPSTGQAIWSAVVRMLEARPSASRRRAANALLTRLSRDDFAPLRTAPPLLYHNDLSATVPRFYWSEDVGYALWLRLYAAQMEGGA